MTPTSTDVRNELIRVLTVLAQPADAQADYLRSLDIVPGGAEARATVDDLALDFDAIAPAAYGREGNGDFSAAELDTIRAVDLALTTMSGERNADLWTEQALRDAPQWAHVRLLAGRALDALARQKRVHVIGGKPSPVSTRR